MWITKLTNKLNQVEKLRKLHSVHSIIFDPRVDKELECEWLNEETKMQSLKSGLC